MPSKKQQQRSPFYHFMIDWKKRMEAKGEHFNGLAAVQQDPRCDREWRNLSPQSKTHYEKLAQQHKSGYKMVKRNNLGEPLSHIEKRLQEELSFKQNMQQNIKEQLETAFENGELQTMKFYFIHTNWFYSKLINEEQIYIPAEYAVAEFSLKHGVTRFEHKLIYVKPHLGYTWEALENSQQTHNIPLELEGAEKDFAKMYYDLLAFLKFDITTNKLPPLYAGKRVYEAVPSILQQMTDAAGCENNFVVYSLEYLFFKLFQLSSQAAVTESIAEEEFLKDRFLYEAGTECEFHRKIDIATQHCSLSIVKQWAFIICDFCCKHLNIELIPGVHIPMKSNPFKCEDTLSSSMQQLTLSNNTKCVGGVSEEYKIKASMRTQEDEQRRRNENMSLRVIDHSKINTDLKAKQQDTSVNVDNDKPLRQPKSFAKALMDEEVPDIKSMDFPSIGGRGRILGRNTNSSTKMPLEKGKGGH